MINDVFCFVEGEPAAFNKETGEYTSLNCNFNEAISFVTEKLINDKKRPGFRKKIWPKLAEFCQLNGYSYYYSKNITPQSYDSFESKFTRKITEILDQKFPRKFITQEERDKLRKQKEAQRAFISENTLKNQREIFMKQKAGRKIY